MAINKKYIIGVDIGGSKINAVVFNGGKVLKNIKIPTSKKSRKKFLNKLEILISEIISESDKKKIAGIGCGIAGALDLEKGIILNAPNLRFLNNFNIKNWLEKKFGFDVEIDNDARCFARGEYLFGAGRGYENAVGITLGTGIGGGIIIKRKIYYGGNGAAGEFGHMIINHNKDFEYLTVKQSRKFKFSKASVKEFRKNLVIGLANIINILDPNIIIVGGGAVDMAKLFLPEARKIINRLVISPKSRKNVKITIGNLGENAGAIGAAALFYEKIYEK